MTQPPKSLTLRIPPEASDAAQRNQLERFVHEFTKHLGRRRGPLVAVQWRKKIDKLMKTNGTTYEQIRTRLEEDANLEILLTYNDLQQICNP